MAQAMAGTEALLGKGGADVLLDACAQRELLAKALESWGGTPRRLLLLAPDATRAHSGAGELTAELYRMCSTAGEVHVLPTLGTHRPMDAATLNWMYPGIPHDKFIVHNWRTEIRDCGVIERGVIRELSEGRLDFEAIVQVNRHVVEGDYDLIISLGQVVPHEVIGLANHNKNILVGAGGVDLLGKSHFLGAVYGMERIMGRSDTPVRRLLDHAERIALAHLPLKYIQTVMQPVAGQDVPVMRGMYLGAGKGPFLAAARLAQQVNVTYVERPIRKAVAWMDPREFHSTWLANKSIYRTRMAMADGGQLIVLAPGVKHFGEDERIDGLIREHGYCGADGVLARMREHEALGRDYATAAHLIHGSPEGRFEVIYAAGGLSDAEVRGVGFIPARLEDLLAQYDPEQLRDGWNEVGGDEIYFVRNPAAGLWTSRPLE